MIFAGLEVSRCALRNRASVAKMAAYSEVVHSRRSNSLDSV
jgi:hypothetical protein